MSLYDTRVIRCVKCDKCLGELDYDAEVTLPLCGQCANPLPEGDDILYTMSHMNNQQNQLVIKH